MRRTSLALILLLMVAVNMAAQRPIRLTVYPTQPPDSADLAYYGKEHPYRACAIVGGFNLGIWAFDRFVQNAPYAHITLRSIGANLTHGFVWDNDQLGTNLFLHPYHGGLYYNGARANGFNFWQSGLFALGGSAMWEFIFENEYPSINDIIATPVGGCAIGEITYRASDIVLKDDVGGWERVGREVAGFLIAPTRGLTRLVNGNTWRIRETPGRRFGIPNVAVEFSAGVRIIELKDKFFDSGAGGIFQFNLEYGDRFQISDSHIPYDYFTFNAHLNVQKSQPVLGQLNITGRLLAKEYLKDRDQVLTLGMYQHFDYYDSDTISDVSARTPYKLGVPASLGAGLMFRDGGTGSWTFDGYAHANAVLLGGVLSDYYRVDMRNYNLASGFSLNAGLNLVGPQRRFSLSGSYKYFRLFTWDGYARDIDWSTVDIHSLNAQGDNSQATFGVGTIRFDFRIWKRLYATAHFSHFYRSTHYRDFPTVRSSTIALRLMLTYKL